MKDITFDSEAKTKYAKEDTEWLRIWCEDVNVENLPRVALIGDSITEGYNQFVKKKLKGIAKVDYLATSYSIASEVYGKIIECFVNDSEYDVVHFNYGLHAYSVDDEAYESRCKGIAKHIMKNSKVILATTTTVLDETLEKENEFWKEKVISRNKKIVKIARELGLKVDDLNKVCTELDIGKRYTDGVHFWDAGYEELAESVALSIQEQLKAL